MKKRIYQGRKGMLFFKIDKKDRKNYIYQQIYENIKQMILDHKLKANDKLPSKRKLANQFDISVNSVTNAYEQLLAEGYIYTIERSGYYVENLTELIREKQGGSTLTSDLKEEPIDRVGWLSFSHITANVCHFPFQEWLKCQQRALKNHKEELADIAHPQGPYLVRKTIAKFIALTRGVVCEPEQIVIGPGTQTLIQRIVQLDPNSGPIALENPGYARFYTLLKQMNVLVKPVDLDEQGIQMDKLHQTEANTVIVTPSHQFPSSIIMPITRRIELLNWAALAKGRCVIEDDYDSEFIYDADRIPSLQSLDRNQRVIYVGTFSKTLLPSFRISYMVLPPWLLRKYREYHIDLIQGNDTLSLFTLHYFIESGEYAKHIKRMNHFYKIQRKKLIKLLKKRFKSHINIIDVPAGLHIFVSFHTNKTYKEIEVAAKKEKLELYTMERFMLQKVNKDQQRIEMVLGFANIEEKDMKEAVERLYRVVV